MGRPLSALLASIVSFRPTEVDSTLTDLWNQALQRARNDSQIFREASSLGLSSTGSSLAVAEEGKVDEETMDEVKFKLLQVSTSYCGALQPCKLLL